MLGGGWEGLGGEMRDCGWRWEKGADGRGWVE